VVTGANANTRATAAPEGRVAGRLSWDPARRWWGQLPLWRPGATREQARAPLARRSAGGRPDM